MKKHTGLSRSDVDTAWSGECRNFMRKGGCLLYGALITLAVTAGCDAANRQACRDLGGIPTDDGEFCIFPPTNQSARPFAEILLADGRLLVCNEAPSVQCWIYEADGRERFPAAPLNFPRREASGILLPDGRVLLTGGLGTEGIPRGDAEIYDPAMDVWTSLDSWMVVGRAGHSSWLMLDGNVLIEGGAPAEAGNDIFLTEENRFEPEPQEPTQGDR